MEEEKLCDIGQYLWEHHLDHIKVGHGEDGYIKYLEHIWACKECQKELELSPDIIQIQKKHFRMASKKSG